MHRAPNLTFLSTPSIHSLRTRRRFLSTLEARSVAAATATPRGR